MKIVLKKKALNYLSRFRKRKFHVFCIGAAKTGTTSIAHYLSSACRSAHEAETLDTNKLIIDKLEHRISKDKLLNKILQRDNRLKLEAEASHPLSYITPELVELFPYAKFIVTVREPYAWLVSRLNFHYKKKPPEWEEYREYFWTSKNKLYEPEEKILKEHNLCSLDTYLKQYAEQYDIILKSVPKERLLIVKTDKLYASTKNIIKFLNLQPEYLLEMPTSNKEEGKITILDSINEGFVRKKIWIHCHIIIKDFFPETINNYDPQ